TAIRDLYAAVDAAVAERAPVCDASGRCCRFDTWGHRLYVTGLEVVWFLQEAGPPGETASDDSEGSVALPQLADAPDQDGCPWQVDRLCTAHDVRPLGCRVYFCEPGTEQWQQALYEEKLEGLRRLHDRHDLPWRYLEWRAGLAEASSRGSSASG
ncbi:MAG: hypothetical protein R3336_09360, partial [Phycisphaeraceae bacterium]|nr:hypothetical protein [Phycisphaeraceae bacterium]